MNRETGKDQYQIVDGVLLKMIDISNRAINKNIGYASALCKTNGMYGIMEPVATANIKEYKPKCPKGYNKVGTFKALPGVVSMDYMTEECDNDVSCYGSLNTGIVKKSVMLTYK